jgi:hypothetical protein
MFRSTGNEALSGGATGIPQAAGNERRTVSIRAAG